DAQGDKQESGGLPDALDLEERSTKQTDGRSDEHEDGAEAKDEEERLADDRTGRSQGASTGRAAWHGHHRCRPRSLPQERQVDRYERQPARRRERDDTRGEGERDADVDRSDASRHAEGVGLRFHGGRVS